LVRSVYSPSPALSSGGRVPLCEKSDGSLLGVISRATSVRSRLSLPRRIQDALCEIPSGEFWRTPLESPRSTSRLETTPGNGLRLLSICLRSVAERKGEQDWISKPEPSGSRTADPTPWPLEASVLGVGRDPAGRLTSWSRVKKPTWPYLELSPPPPHLSI
jgi:hypothetical protein